MGLLGTLVYSPSILQRSIGWLIGLTESAEEGLAVISGNDEFAGAGKGFGGHCLVVLLWMALG